MCWRTLAVGRVDTRLVFRGCGGVTDVLENVGGRVDIRLVFRGYGGMTDVLEDVVGRSGGYWAGVQGGDGCVRGRWRSGLWLKWRIRCIY